ncbi:MAG TPA: hypothetical protein VFT99_26315, partial [Roseiflexaceae bacterium]|nr:hypothetical protein [Roseiflexaceae bacterium]
MTHISRRVLISLGSLMLCGGLIAMRPYITPQSTPPAASVAQAPQAVPLPTAQPVATPAEAFRTSDDTTLDGSQKRYGTLSVEGSSEVVPAGAEAKLAPPAAPAPAPPARPWVIPGKGPLMRGQLVAQTARVDVYVGKGTFDPDVVAEVAPALERMLLEDEQGFWPTRLERRISIGFYSMGSAPSKGVRGMAYTADGRIEVYFRPNEDIRSAVTIA